MSVTEFSCNQLGLLVYASKHTSSISWFTYCNEVTQKHMAYEITKYKIAIITKHTRTKYTSENETKIKINN